MADDKLKRAPRERVKEATCGLCERAPETRCPTCPQSEDRRKDQSWNVFRARSPQDYAVEHAAALAARRLAISHDAHMLYPEYLAAYQAACEARDRYWAVKREGLPKARGTRHEA